MCFSSVTGRHSSRDSEGKQLGRRCTSVNIGHDSSSSIGRKCVNNRKNRRAPSRTRGESSTAFDSILHTGQLMNEPSELNANAAGRGAALCLKGACKSRGDTVGRCDEYSESCVRCTYVLEMLATASAKYAACNSVPSDI